MDMATKIVTLIGAIIGAGCGFGIMIGIKHIREGMSDDNSQLLNKGVTNVITGAAFALAIGGVVAYVNGLFSAIQF
jgi:uncharacterized membrane protein YqgA involved in biofilm formation